MPANEFYPDQIIVGDVLPNPYGGVSITPFLVSGVPASMISFLDAPSLDAIRAIVREELQKAIAEMQPVKEAQ